MSTATSPYGLPRAVSLSQDEAIERAKAALATEGFGILCELDIAATLKAKLDVDFPPYVILGACNPQLAHRALTAEPEIGLLLPCNVVIYQDAEHRKTTVVAMDPVAALALTHNDRIAAVAAEAKERLQRVIDSLPAAE